MALLPILLGVGLVALVAAGSKKKQPKASEYVPLIADSGPGAEFLHGRIPLTDAVRSVLAVGQIVHVPFGTLTAYPPFVDHLVLVRATVTAPAGPKKWTAHVDEVRERLSGAESGGPEIGSTFLLEPYLISTIEA